MTLSAAAGGRAWRGGGQGDAAARGQNGSYVKRRAQQLLRIFDRVVISSVVAALLSVEFGGGWLASLLPHRCYSFERLIAGFPSRLTVDMEYFCPIPDTRNVTQCYSVKTGRVSTIVHRGNANRESGGADSIRRLAHMCSDRFLTKSEILS